ncbi:hypothetical protein L226DRAFT_564733 [Lentinus tigrinus ALCF2SS1-7]|uniref:DRBM domain-containing protein n=1 Tax=Lentinus tigrinus ALCF2SS1-6 TaxID=1328759 RepID=A0A5C2SP07_9APHY|nr:hypothetical protein L227DRAFT_607639 [Lentinus tigrinus ALCF2SS1-6]RPD82119.1 hypothetical protein L226DRAFT_564733 [Lentinus tigrinus ALCF2SS1-7]
MANNADGTVALNNCATTPADCKYPLTDIAIDLQNKGNTSSLSWEDKYTGPRHAVEWTSTCKIDGKAVASGSGLQKNLARDAAAREALVILAAEEAAASASNDAAAK